MRIGIIGCRGIPNAYGGFEELAEHLSLLLVKKGHEVFVYNSHTHPYQESTYHGVNIIHKKDPEKKLGTFGQFIYDFNCIRDCRKQKFDVVLQLGYTSSSIWWWLFPKKTRILTNMDGLEWKRSKYNSFTQKFLAVAERLAAKHSHLLVADNKEIEIYLSKKYTNQKVVIAYGASVPTYFNQEILKEYHVEKHNYLLCIARLEPENNVETIIQGALKSKTVYPLLIVGNTQTKHGKYLTKKYQSVNIVFIDALYNKEVLNSLRHYCRIYFHGHSVGGTNPALLEAMACHSLIAAHHNNFNKTTLNNNAYFWLDNTDVANLIDHSDFNEIALGFIKDNLSLIREKYAWRIITEQYEITMLQLAIG